MFAEVTKAWPSAARRAKRRRAEAGQGLLRPVAVPEAHPLARLDGLVVRDRALARCDPDHTAAVDPPPAPSLSGGRPRFARSTSRVFDVYARK